MAEPGEPRIAVVLSGGGARGAYEAGVLSYVLDELPALLGRPVVFVDNHDHAVPSWPSDPFVIARPAKVGLDHALASAAIPVLFAPRRLDGAFYCDGGLRLNTPLSPALRLGADRVLVIGLRHRRPSYIEDRLARHREVSYL